MFCAPVPVISDDSLADYQNQIEEDEWDSLYASKSRKPTSVGPETKQGREILKPFETIFRKRTPKGSKLIGTITAFKNWAIFRGHAASASGDQITPEDGIASDTTVLLLKVRSGWVVVDYGLGHSDLFYIIWPAKYGAPVELLSPAED